jgi:hypothetical protein
MMKPSTLAALVAAASALAGCGTLAKAAGVTKNTPDEFRVVTKAPLVIPPDYALRPPRPGDARPQELRPEDDARAALFGKDIGAAASPGEKDLVAKAGAGSVDPRIRDQVDLESAALVRKDESFTDRLLSFGRKRSAEDSTIIDPHAEQARLDQEDQVRRATGAGQVTIERDGSGGVKLPGL